MLRFLLFVVWVSSTLAQLTTCTTGRISLSRLPAMTMTVGTTAYTLGYCSTVNPVSTTLTRCSTAGYLAVHDTTTGSCAASYPNIITGLAQIPTGASFLVGDSSGTLRANVTIMCDRTGTAATAALLQPVTSTTASGVTTLLLRLTSYSGCSVDSFFCGPTVACEDSARSCVSGVCVDTSCTTVQAISSAVAYPANFISQVAVQDCHGTPVPNLPNTSFEMYIDGVSIKDPTFTSEATSVISNATQSPIPMVTTVLLDQSASVQQNAQTQLKAAVLSFIDSVSVNSNHYVALIVFDGTAGATVVSPHTTDFAALRTAVNGLPPALSDPASTNLYGAVMMGVEESYHMKFSFGNISDSVTSSMIVFTDGHDTASRVTRSAAISKALAFASDVRIMSVGVSNTSDADFLTQIATSGYASFVSVSDLSSTFTDIASKLKALISNTYMAMLCVPSRSTGVTLTVGLNTTQFPSNPTASFVVDASNFTGGCTAAQLWRYVDQSSSATSTPALDVLASGTISRVLSPDGAYFFNIKVANSGMTVTVSPTAVTVFYLKSSRCKLSAFCYDGQFNSSFVPDSGVLYSAMAVSSFSTSVTVTLSVTAVTTTVPPGWYFTTGATSGSLIIPLPTLDVYNLTHRSWDAAIDEGGTIVFLVWGLLSFVGFVSWLVYAICLGHVMPMINTAANEMEKSMDTYATYSPARMSASGSLGRSLLASQSYNRQLPLTATRSLGRGPVGMLTGQASPVFSEVQPYRGAPLEMHTLSSLMSPHSGYSPERRLDLDNI